MTQAVTPTRTLVGAHSNSARGARMAGKFMLDPTSLVPWAVDKYFFINVMDIHSSVGNTHDQRPYRPVTPLLEGCIKHHLIPSTTIVSYCFSSIVCLSLTRTPAGEQSRPFTLSFAEFKVRLGTSCTCLPG